MKRFLIELPDDFQDRPEEVIDMAHVTSCREFTSDRVQKDLPLAQLSALQDERIDEVSDEDPAVPDEAEVMRQCSALSKQLALLSKKKPISLRK